MFFHLITISAAAHWGIISVRLSCIGQTVLAGRPGRHHCLERENKWIYGEQWRHNNCRRALLSCYFLILLALMNIVVEYNYVDDDGRDMVMRERIFYNGAVTWCLSLSLALHMVFVSCCLMCAMNMITCQGINVITQRDSQREKGTQSNVQT